MGVFGRGLDCACSCGFGDFGQLHGFKLFYVRLDGADIGGEVHIASETIHLAAVDLLAMLLELPVCGLVMNSVNVALSYCLPTKYRTQFSGVALF